MTMKDEKIRIHSDERSLDRPAWTQDDLHAYRHKHTLVNGKRIIIKDYFVQSEGKA